MASRFRSLSAEEIGKLASQGCSCADWSDVEVAEGFDAAKVRSTHFSGRVKLGVFEKEVSFFSGVKCLSPQDMPCLAQKKDSRAA